MKERDEARDALAKVSIEAGASTGGDEMQIDNQRMPEYVVDKVTKTHQEYVPFQVLQLVLNHLANVLQAFLNTQETSSTSRLGNCRHTIYPRPYTYL